MRNSGLPFVKILYMLTGNSIRFILQLVTFVVLARALKPEGYGTLAAALAVVNLAAPLVELGGYSLVVKHVARDPQRTGRWVGNQIRLSLATAPIAVALLVLAKLVWLPTIPSVLIICLGLGEYIGSRMGAVAAGVWVGHGLIRYNAGLDVVSGMFRLLLATLLLRFGGGVKTWGIMHLTSTMAIGWTSVILVRWRFGGFSHDWQEIKHGLTEGFHFAIGRSSENAYTDLDKIMLARLSGTGIAGIYGAAYRFVAVAMVPLGALNAVMYPRYFDAGKGGVKECMKVARSVLPFSVGYGALAWMGLAAGAFLVPRILGSEYQNTGLALPFLGPLVLVDSAIYPISDILTGAGQQRRRSTLQIGTLLLNASLCLALIPTMGWRGALLAALVSRIALLVALLGTVGASYFKPSERNV